jgi:hypothetical protein
LEQEGREKTVMDQGPVDVVDNVVDVGEEKSYLLGALVASIELPSLKHFRTKVR